MSKHRETNAFCLLPTADLQADVDFFISTAGFQLKELYPADSPEVAELVGFGLSIRLDSSFKGGAPTLVIKTENDVRPTARSPGGVEVRWERYRESVVQSLESHQLEICTLRGTPWVRGKAGTQTRDLIPSRLGGGMVATHIRIPNGGPVSDQVHYHTANFQLVFCVRGWITLVYEDQGQPITLQAGDCVTQPPHIRHKVLETSNGLEVLEIGMPAEHVTAIDNDMSLPNTRVDSHRLFDGQRFCHHELSKAQWQPHRLPGFAACDTGVSVASAGAVGASVVKAANTLPAAYTVTHNATVLFSYVLAGSLRIDQQLLVAGDAFTLPPGESRRIGDISEDVQILELSVPGTFRTLV
ncbi:MAG: cupin domain-containing protein [Granulosicoccus sp.]